MLIFPNILKRVMSKLLVFVSVSIYISPKICDSNLWMKGFIKVTCALRNM